MWQSPFPLDLPKDEIRMLAQTLHRLGSTTLHLQAASCAVQQPTRPLRFEKNSASGRAITEARNSMLAVTRHYLEQQLPQLRGLMAEIKAVAETAAEGQTKTPAELAHWLRETATEFDDCRASILAISRATPRALAMIRVSEQRLWGNLAAEMDRIERHEGPLAACTARIEALSFDLVAAVQHLPDMMPDLSLAERIDVSYAICSAVIQLMDSSEAARRLPQVLSPEIAAHPELGQRVNELVAEYTYLAARSPLAAQALSLGTQASCHLLLTRWLDEILEELDGAMTKLVRGYRAEANDLKPSSAAMTRTDFSHDGHLWSEMVEALAEPLALSNRLPMLLARQQAERARVAA